MKPFITSNSGNGEYYVKVRLSSISELDEAHDIIIRAFHAPEELNEKGLELARKAAEEHAAAHDEWTSEQAMRAALKAYEAAK